ncbi:hypothetical protein FRC08_001113 [Ceratobasidium sp. 394]|nr:hypothetical protein FRC08_001113 [Ceratobasidium sp. 394]KAG9098632.1 hypothetical protein FS749_003351 [Ceratobasidium sp. UAMH 11750]
MLLDTDVITRSLVVALWLGSQYVIAAPTSVIAASAAPTSTSYDSNPTSYPNPYGIDPSNDSSSPMTTIIIVTIVGSISLLCGAWAAYNCMVKRRKSLQVAPISASSSMEPTTTMICIPGETYASTAIPALRYNSPHRQPVPNLEGTEVGPGVIIPPPPSYDTATGGRRPDSVIDDTAASGAVRPVQTRSDSRWKDLLVVQGRS